MVKMQKLVQAFPLSRREREKRIALYNIPRRLRICKHSHEEDAAGPIEAMVKVTSR